MAQRRAAAIHADKNVQNHGRPLQLTAKGVRGKILDYAGPWKTPGDWWSQNPWNREEWDIGLGSGALYRIYSEDLEDQQIYDLLQEIEMEADLRYCFTEADVSERGTERSW